jgi:hypothetical protein
MTRAVLARSHYTASRFDKLSVTQEAMQLDAEEPLAVHCVALRQAQGDAGC